MSHPDISFRFINNNQPKLQTVGNGNLKDVIYAVYGREISANLIEIHEKFDTFQWTVLSANRRSAAETAITKIIILTGDI